MDWTAQVCLPLCAFAARADSLPLQLVVAFRLVSSRSVRRSLRHPYGIVPHRIRRHFPSFALSQSRSTRPIASCLLFGSPDRLPQLQRLGGLLGRFASSCCFERTRSCSDAFCRFFGTYPEFSSRLDPAAASTSAPRSSGSPGASFGGPPFCCCPERTHLCSDTFMRFFGTSQASSTRSDTAVACVLPPRSFGSSWARLLGMYF